MLRAIALMLGGACLWASAAGCSRPPETVPPVATPAVTLERTDVPAGSPIDVTYRFTVVGEASSFDEDYFVFVHFLDADGELLWTDDHQPTPPTQEWEPAATVEYTRTMFVPRLAAIGATAMEIGLYSRNSGARLPLAGEDAGMRSYRVATFNVTAPDEATTVAFARGWHEEERGTDAAGSWRWSRKQGVLSFRNPGRDATLVLQLDQPVNPFGEPQHLELRIGDAVVDAFPVPPGERVIRRVPLSASQLGDGGTVDVTLTVNRTFIPAAVPELKSSDQRELGIRVQAAAIQVP